LYPPLPPIGYSSKLFPPPIGYSSKVIYAPPPIGYSSKLLFISYLISSFGYAVTFFLTVLFLGTAAGAFSTFSGLSYLVGLTF
jgi:hypothetical protein